MTFVEACRAFRQATGGLPLSITVMIEGEEECGSKHLFDFVRDNAKELRRDLIPILPGVLPSGLRYTGRGDRHVPAVDRRRSNSDRGVLDQRNDRAESGRDRRRWRRPCAG